MFLNDFPQDFIIIFNYRSIFIILLLLNAFMRIIRLICESFLNLDEYANDIRWRNAGFKGGERSCLKSSGPR